MDKINFVSKFTNGIISKIIKKFLSKKLESDIDIQVNEISLDFDDEISVHISLDGKIKKEDLIKILSKNHLI